MTEQPFTKLSTLLFSTFLLLTACGTPGFEPDEEKPPQKIPATEMVPADGILEAVTWNIEHFGRHESFKQTKNAVRVMDSLNADLFALQEIYSQDVLDKLLEPLTGYEGLVAPHPNKGQKMAFAYNTNTISVLNSGFISSTEVRDRYADQWSYYWANGRMPFYVNFRYAINETKSKDFYAVIIHGKANTGSNAQEYEEAYTRRQMAAEGLYYYLQDHKPDANIVMLGDYNDDVDQSLFYYDKNNFAETPYDEFVDDTASFSVITHVLSDDKKSSSIKYLEEGNLIDHITMSDELFDKLIDSSAAVYYAPQDYISEYGESTSDHLPVWVKFDLTKN